MKIAICLHGQPRNYEIGFSHLQREFISKYDTDVFAHTWWSLEQVGQYYYTGPLVKKDYKIEANFPEKINNLYHFKDVIYEASKNFNSEKQYNVPWPDKHDNTIDSHKSRFYSFKNSLQLCENYEKDNHIEYDWIILTRFEIAIYTMPLLSTLNKDNIYVDNFHSGRPYIFNDNLWLFGNYKYFFKNLYDDFDKNYEMMLKKQESPFYHLIQNIDELSNCNIINGEQFIAFYLLFNGLLDKVIKHAGISYNLIR